MALFVVAKCDITRGSRPTSSMTGKGDDSTYYSPPTGEPWRGRGRVHMVGQMARRRRRRQLRTIHLLEGKWLFRTNVNYIRICGRPVQVERFPGNGTLRLSSRSQSNITWMLRPAMNPWRTVPCPCTVQIDVVLKTDRFSVPKNHWQCHRLSDCSLPGDQSHETSSAPQLASYQIATRVGGAGLWLLYCMAAVWRQGECGIVICVAIRVVSGSKIGLKEFHDSWKHGKCILKFFWMPIVSILLGEGDIRYQIGRVANA
jgi:hypothetical protein